MSQDHSGDSRSDGLAVVEWGDRERGGDEKNRLSGWARLPATVLRDRRLIPLVAGLAALAIFASLVSEWQVTRVQLEDSSLTQQMSVGVAWLDGWSAAYLVGVFAVTSCLALVLFGPHTAREHLRVTGLAISAAVLAVLVAITVDLGRNSAALNGLFLFGPPGERYELSYGPGLLVAFLGVAGYALALHLAGQHSAGRRHSPAAGTNRATGPGSPVVNDDPLDWPWRRPHPSREPESDPSAPIDLSVQPVNPFVHLPEDPEAR